MRGGLGRTGFFQIVTAALLALSAALSTAGCSTPPAGRSEALRLRIGLLPIVDVLPLYVAETEGYFKEQNLEVELITFASALERDAAFQAGQIDGELNDLVSAALLNKDGDRARVVRTAYQGNPSMAMMLVLVAPGSKIQSARELKGVPVAISNNTVIEYATDRLLESAGLGESDIVKTEVTKIPVRLEMLVKGQVQAATLPEPFASLAVQQGARVVIDDSQSGIGQSVITIRREVAEGSPEAISRFLLAYEKAVDAIHGSPNKYQDLLVEKAKVPDPLRNSFRIPAFPRAQVPKRDDVDAVIQWMLKKGMLSQAIAYERMVDSRFLPKG